MNERDFVYWLQGFAELHPEPPTPEQWQSIREHLALVFEKKTRPLPSPPERPKPFVPFPDNVWPGGPPPFPGRPPVITCTASFRGD